MQNVHKFKFYRSIQFQQMTFKTFYPNNYFTSLVCETSVAVGTFLPGGRYPFSGEHNTIIKRGGEEDSEEEECIHMEMLAWENLELKRSRHPGTKQSGQQ